MQQEYSKLLLIKPLQSPLVSSPPLTPSIFFSMETLKPHVALLSSPGMGHILPTLELAQRLTTCHRLTVTIFLVASPASPAENQVIDSAKSLNLFSLVELPPVDTSGLIDSTTAVVTQLAIIMRQNLPALRLAISALNSRPTVLIVDLFGTEAFSIADEFQMAKYVFIASHAWFLALTVYTPVLDKEVEGEYVDQKELIQIPGCEPVRPMDVNDPMLDRTNQQYNEYVRIGVEIALSDGVLVNTWEGLQGRTLAAFRDKNRLGRVMKAPVYAIGPVVRRPSSVKGESELFEWLSKQPSQSVIYVAFGSSGTISFEQMTEVALGLELSRQRFVWVVRPPAIKSDAAFFTAGDGTEELSEARYFPDGFLSRTREVGVLVPMWAEQAAILSHLSVGGFLTHAGWNSSLESLTNGVPMVAWPLYAEQRMNATMLADELRVAVRPKAQPSKELVGREEIAALVRKIMVEKGGKAVRANAREVKRSAEKAVAEGGSSYQELGRVAKLFNCSSHGRSASA